MQQQSEPENLSTVLARVPDEMAQSQKSTDTLIGRRFGPYRLVAEIGHGGMGVVYRAIRVDGEFDDTVAIKVVRNGLRFDLMPERFRTERQIQARLRHPNIVRLLDGGTTEDNLTYFVMEYIEGLPLTKYCDSQQLSITDRLHLFRRICDAVAYAHQNLVVHRDLKPDNILVTADGVPKLLDFGIAKLLESSGDGAEPTMTMVRMGTPAYASPEQIRGEPVGVATDVYSLGVNLYELLTGRRPYNLEALGWDESARIICERDTTRPSSIVTSKSTGANDTEEISRARKTTVDGLRKRLSGDLDNIVSAALRKDPLRRYRSVDQFSDEIRNHLEHRPIKGRGDSVVYKLSKLVGRHKLGTAVAAGLTVLLLAATGFAVWQAHRLTLRLDEDRKLATSFLVDVHEAIAKLPGSTPVREALLTKSLKYLNGVAVETGQNPEMRRALALAYERFADLQAGVEGAGLGDSRQALRTYEKARDFRETLVREHPDDKAAQFDLASNYLMGSFIAGRASTLDRRMAYDNKALAISRKLAIAQPANAKYQALLAKAYMGVAYGQGMMTKWPQAVESYGQALAIREQLAGAAPNDRPAQRDLATLHYRIGVIETQSARPVEARPHLYDALAIQTRLLEADDNNERLRSEVASTHHFLGMALGATGDTPHGLEQFQQAIALRERTLAADNRDARTRSLLAGNYAERASLLLKAGQNNEALTNILHAVSLQNDLLTRDPHGVPTRLSLADYHARLATIYVAAGNNSQGAQGWRSAKALYDELDREGHLTASDSRHDAERARAEFARHAAR